MNKYEFLMIISIICLAGDCDNFTAFIIWHLVWFMIMIICARNIGKVTK